MNASPKRNTSPLTTKSESPLVLESRGALWRAFALILLAVLTKLQGVLAMGCYFLILLAHRRYVTIFTRECVRFLNPYRFEWDRSSFFAWRKRGGPPWVYKSKEGRTSAGEINAAS
jgi:hypothetical protein